MKTLEYTPRILTLISAGKKLEAVKMAKDLYGLSLQEAKNMIDSYRPGGNNWYTTMELNDTPEYTPDIIELINEGKTLDVILMLKDRYGLSAEDAKKMIENYPQSKTSTKPVESTTTVRHERQQTSTVKPSRKVDRWKARTCRSMGCHKGGKSLHHGRLWQFYSRCRE